jgi:hypothetical protein
VQNAPTLPETRLQALGEFICADPRRAMAAARLFRGAQGTIDSEVSGVSMGGVIPDGAFVRIAADPESCRVGEVVAFFAGGRSVVHRVRWMRRNWLITQGDAMLLPDVPVPRDAVLGRVIAVRADGDWRPPAAKPLAPRRERALSWIVFAAGVALLELHPPLARRFLDLLTRAERRHAWTRSLLY